MRNQEGEMMNERTKKKIIGFGQWFVPTLFLIGCAYAWGIDASDRAAVVGIALSCIWEGINIQRHFAGDV
jgi:hypothetical protein